jgi:DNA-binding NarL/FixJ family response regulator
MSSEDYSAGHIGVYLVDDHPPIRVAIRDRIDGIIDMEVCGESGSSEEALHQIREVAPTVAVVDLCLEDGHGFDLIENLRVQCPDVRPVVFSMYNEKTYAKRTLRAGGSGYLMKNDSTSALMEAIRTASEGDVYLSEKMTSRVLGHMDGESPGPSFPIDELTDRELSVLQMLGEGYSVEEIGERLDLARKTIETYRRRAKEKLGFDKVSKLLQFAILWRYGQGTGEDGGPTVPTPPADQ